MKKTLICLGLLTLFVAGCRGSKIDVSGCYTQEGKKESYEVKFSITLSSAEQRFHEKLGKLKSAVARTKTAHEKVCELANEVQGEYTQLVDELEPPAKPKTFLQVWAEVRPANGETGTASEKLEQRVKFTEFSTNASFLTFRQTYEEVCRKTKRSKEWQAAQEAKVNGLIASLYEVKCLVADIEALAPAVVEGAGSRPKLRNPLVRLQNKEDFLGGLVTVKPPKSLLDELHRLAKKWEAKPERPNIKLAVGELALTELAEQLLAETGKSN